MESLVLRNIDTLEKIACPRLLALNKVGGVVGRLVGWFVVRGAVDGKEGVGRDG